MKKTYHVKTDFGWWTIVALNKRELESFCLRVLHEEVLEAYEIDII